MKDPIIEKIEKLLNTTGRTPEEAATAVAMAQRLMAKYHIEQNDLFHSTDKIDWFKVPKTTKGFSNRLMKIVCSIAEHYRCKVAISKYEIWLFGYKKDTQAANYVVQYLWRTYDKLLAKYSKTFPTDRQVRYRMNNEFLSGFCVGVNKALQQNEEQYALTLYTKVPQEVIDDFEHKTEKTGKSRRGHLETDGLGMLGAMAYAAGCEEGEKAMRTNGSISVAALSA